MFLGFCDGQPAKNKITFQNFKTGILWLFKFNVNRYYFFGKMSIDEFTQFRSSLDFETFKAYKFALITLLTFKHGDNHFNSHTSYTKMCVVFCSSFFFIFVTRKAL